jgi:hypothetical protein
MATAISAPFPSRDGNFDLPTSFPLDFFFQIGMNYSQGTGYSAEWIRQEESRHGFFLQPGTKEMVVDGQH